MDEVKIQKVLCPLDYSEYSQHGLEYALHRADMMNSQVHVLHTGDVALRPSYRRPGMPGLGMPVEELEAGANDRMDEIVEECRETHENTQGSVRTGTPFLEIINYAKELPADLVVMGTHGRTGLKHMLIGSVAEKVVRKSPCPVLTVKHPHHQFEMP